MKTNKWKICDIEVHAFDHGVYLNDEDQWVLEWHKGKLFFHPVGLGANVPVWYEEFSVANKTAFSEWCNIAEVKSKINLESGVEELEEVWVDWDWCT